MNDEYVTRLYYRSMFSMMSIFGPTLSFSDYPYTLVSSYRYNYHLVGSEYASTVRKFRNLIFSERIPTYSPYL